MADINTIENVETGTGTEFESETEVEYVYDFMDDKPQAKSKKGTFIGFAAGALVVGGVTYAIKKIKDRRRREKLYHESDKLAEVVDAVKAEQKKATAKKTTKKKVTKTTKD